MQNGKKEVKIPHLNDYGLHRGRLDGSIKYSFVRK
jgi:hypothetical protein